MRSTPLGALLPKHLSHDVGLESSPDIADAQWHSPRGEHTSDSVWQVADPCGGGALAFWVPIADGDDGAVGAFFLSVCVCLWTGYVRERGGAGTQQPSPRQGLTIQADSG